jgi:hypothetical protein
MQHVQKDRTVLAQLLAAAVITVCLVAGYSLATPTPAHAATLVWFEDYVGTNGVIGPTRPLNETSARRITVHDPACTNAVNLNNNFVGSTYCSWDLAVHPYCGCVERRPWAGTVAVYYGYAGVRARVNW